MSLKLTDSVVKVPGIGTKYEKLLELLDIQTIEDFIYYFPFRYDDFTTIKPIAEWQVGESVTVTATIQSITNVVTKNGKRMTIAQISDSSDKINAVWFNQHFLLTVLKKGHTYNFSGKVSAFNNKLSLVNPIYETSEKTLNTQGLIPIYYETDGVSSKWLRTKINDILKEIELEEYLPTEILEKKNLIGIQEAIKNVHFPENEETKVASRKRLAFEELFLELLNVEKRKHIVKESKALKFDQGKIKEFIKTLPFQLTTDQHKVTEEILEDISKNKQMNRLLAGDVGSGKTIVAVIAAFATHLAGYKTLYLAPTEILAKQHTETFKKFWSSETSKDIEAVQVGTHALLYKKGYENVGLVIIDEQHRFGVEQRHKLSHELTGSPHVLSMTATPIPRTLALTIYGDLDISLINTVPNKDKKIITKTVTHRERNKVYEWLKTNDKQAFIVCPLIEESEYPVLANIKSAQTEFNTLKTGVLKNKKLGLLHGRMKKEEKEAVLNDFREKRIDVLISTPVIEVGIDVPDAEVILIESAERYGLASLHQLRGRVGRGQKTGYCFAIMSDNAKGSYSRLKNLETIDNGLKLAELDMALRGKGDIFGTMQHGFKDFRLADLSDLETLEDVKKLAKEFYPKINTYPNLLKRLDKMYGKLVVAN